MLSLAAAKSLTAPSAEPADGKDSSRERFERIAVAHYDFVWRVVRRFGLPPSAADDVTQQVFLVASRRVADIEEGAEKGFLYRAAVLIAMDSQRKHTRLREASGDAAGETVDPALGPDELVDRRRAQAMLVEAIAQLDEDVREVFALFELEGMPVAEIAEIVKIPEGTCSSRLRRAREQFMSAVARLKARGKRRAP